MQELISSTYDKPDDLFLERLDAFCLAEMKAFAEREHRPLEETRQYVAEWHSKYLFQPQAAVAGSSASPQHRIDRVKAVLFDASRMLESLCDACGVQSYLLAVDPSNATDSGFLGGSVFGREYYRGLRGGGDAGARAFKAHCLKNVPATTPNVEASSSSITPKVSAARSAKADLYEGVRKALRSASGVRNAEMKWTNPTLLSVYGVCLVGWPPAIPAQNPSSLKASQNKELLNALESGTMHFVRNLRSANEPQAEAPAPSTSAADDSCFSWAIQYDDSPPISSGQDSSVLGGSESSFLVRDGGSGPAKKRARVEEHSDDTVYS